MDQDDFVRVTLSAEETAVWRSLQHPTATNEFADRMLLDHGFDRTDAFGQLAIRKIDDLGPRAVLVTNASRRLSA